MLHTVLERFAESRVECVLGYSRVVSNVASIIALQTAAIEEVHNVLRGLPASSRDDVLERVREGRLQVPGGRRPRLAREDLPPLRRTRRRSVRADRLGQLLHLRAARRSARGAHPLSRRPRLGGHRDDSEQLCSDPAESVHEGCSPNNCVFTKPPTHRTPHKPCRGICLLPWQRAHGMPSERSAATWWNPSGAGRSPRGSRAPAT